MKTQRIDRSGLILVIAGLVLAIIGAFMFGNRLDQSHAVLAGLISLLGLAGVYSLSRK
jgi:uncharacterized membrane protein